jgi:flagellum-specific peptidoglycan hydrolase FlgJ
MVAIIAIVILVLVIAAVALGFVRIEKPTTPGTIDRNVSWSSVLGRVGGSLRKQEAFVAAFKALGVDQLVQTWGANALALAAVAVHETGWGTSHACMVHNNLFGISHSEGGTMVPNAYDTVQACLTDMKRVLSLSRYSSLPALAGSPELYAQALAQAGYGPSGSWVEYSNQLKAIIRELPSYGWNTVA